jgi:hypothetical protein
MAKNENPTPEDNMSSHYEDTGTQNRIHEHLNNKEDIITEQDIANIRTDITNPSDVKGSISEMLPMDEEDKAAADDLINKERIIDNDDPVIKTTWNILEN